MDSRGTLVPLYPTLAGQIAAIARAYGLPSSGGIALYLMDASAFTDPLIDHLTGGPRIGEEAWSLLWAPIFEADEDLTRQLRLRRAAEDALLGNGALPHEDDSAGLGSDYDEDDDDDAWSSSALGHVPPVPPLPSTYGRDEEAWLADVNAAQPHRLPPSRRPPSSSRTVPHAPRRSNTVRSNASRRALSSFSTLSHPDLRLSARSALKARSPSPISGGSIIVGKVEFDIDRRRGGGKWFEAWLDGASSPATPNRVLSVHTNELVLPSVVQARSGEDSGYAPLRDDASDYELSSRKSSNDEPLSASASSAPEPRRDPLADVFGRDEMHWQRLAGGPPSDLAPASAFAPQVEEPLRRLSIVSITAEDDDVTEVTNLIKARHPALSSPIHNVPSPDPAAGFTAALDNSSPALEVEEPLTSEAGQGEPATRGLLGQVSSTQSLDPLSYTAALDPIAPPPPAKDERHSYSQETPESIFVR